MENFIFCAVFEPLMQLEGTEIKELYNKFENTTDYIKKDIFDIRRKFRIEILLLSVEEFFYISIHTQ